MADNEGKELDPTAKRLQQAREQGNVFHSPEVVSVGSLLVAVTVLFAWTPAGFAALKELSANLFLSAAATNVTPEMVPRIIMELGLQILGILAPYLAVMMIAGVALNVLQSGWNVTTKVLTPKLDRLNPMSGAKRIFSAQGLFQTLKALLKLAIVAPLAYTAISGRMPELMTLFTLPLTEIVTVAGGWIHSLLLQILMALVLVSGIDFAYGKWKYKNDLKMSHQEVKEESKEQEGDPHIKGKRRQFALAMIRKPRLIDAVLKADVVITNPTHYAIALRYDPVEGRAPRVLVKGMRKRALRIKELAREHHIPMVEDRPLARTLYKMVPEEQEIPEDLYPAVAAILAEIYRARGGYDRPKAA